MAASSSASAPPRAAQPPAHVLRVNQLDARRLDGEIATLLRQQLLEILPWRTGFGARISDLMQPEFDLLLQAALWRYTIWADAPTPGGQLQNMKWARADSTVVALQPLQKGQKLGFLFVHALFPWLATRLEGAAQAFERTSNEPSGRIRRWLSALARWYIRTLAPRVGVARALLAAVHFVVFLRRGVFCTISDRILGIRMMHIDPTAHRQPAFEYMNRVMLWNGVSEFLMTVVPLIDLARLRQTLTRRFLPKAMLQSMAAGSEQTCGLCGVSPMTLPMRSDCGHVFCYFCVASEQMAMGQSTRVVCPYCSARIQSIRHAR